MIEQHKHIVFGNEHYNPLGVIRSLGEYGIRPIAIIINKKRKLVSKSKYISKCHIVSSIEEGYQLLLNQYGQESVRPFLYSTDDSFESLIDDKYDELKDKFFFFNAGLQGRVNYYMNKENIGMLALKYGLNFLKAYRVRRGEIPEGLEYPVITKAIDSKSFGWKADMHICQNEEELKRAFEKISSEEILIQKYIYKKNEYCLEGISVNKGQDVFISIASTYNYLLKHSYSPYMTVRNFKNAEIETKIKGMFKEIGFEGIYEIEFLVDQEDKLYFGEINFRNSTWSYASTCAGMNLPVLWSRGMLQGHIDKNAFKVIKNGFTAMVELSDLKHRVKEGGYSVFKWLKDYKNSDCRYYMGKHDIKPVIYMFISMIFKQRKGR